MSPRLAEQTLQADLYASALTVALDRDADPAARAAASELMRDLAGDMRKPAEDHSRYQHRGGALTDLIGDAIDHRIYGPHHYIED